MFSWAEADADTAEAIDFLEFYAREAFRYAGKQPITHIESEQNDLVYIPLGVGAVIPPWNFPLAIMAGMTTAAVVTGNTVVLKPSSDAPWIAYRFFALLEEAGMPPGVVNFVSGGGMEVGEPLVQHPRIRFISFTGSKGVGLHIVEEAAKHREGQLWIKRVVAEMGGKDAIIVDRDWKNLDEAATAVVASAFGFQGQKCSACSRAIIDEAIYDSIVPMIVEKTKALRMGDPAVLENAIGPVVNEKAMKNIKNFIDKGTKEGGRLVAGGNTQPENGFFVEPTVIADVTPDATIAQEEIFGPVLAIIKAKDFDDALRIANGTEFGLTGAVFTDSEDGPKDLLLENSGCGFDIRDDRGLDEIARARRRAAASNQSAFLETFLDVVENRIACLVVDHGAHLRGRIFGRADGELRCPLGDHA